MPGLLREDAWCPLCGREIISVGRTTRCRFGRALVVLEFMHDPKNYKYDHQMSGDMEQMDRIHDRLTVHFPPAPGDAGERGTP
jgi:hypothetical protein